MAWTQYAAQALNNSFFGKTSNFGALASAPTLYFGVSSTDPTGDGSGITEPSGGAYARQAVVAADFNASTAARPSVVTNANDITFPQATATWLGGADILYGFLADSGTTGAGNVLWYGALAVAKPVTNGDTLVVPAGSFSQSES